MPPIRERLSRCQRELEICERMCTLGGAEAMLVATQMRERTQSELDSVKAELHAANKAKDAAERAADEGRELFLSKCQTLKDVKGELRALKAGQRVDAVPSSRRAALSEEEQRALDARLYEAAYEGEAGKVVRLAWEGAIADAKDGEGWPAVLAATLMQHTDVVVALLRLGCDPNAPNSYGVTALMLAAKDGDAALLGELVEAGGDATLRATGGDYEGKTALDLAEEGGHGEVAALLRTASVAETTAKKGGGRPSKRKKRRTKSKKLKPRINKRRTRKKSKIRSKKRNIKKKR